MNRRLCMAAIPACAPVLAWGAPPPAGGEAVSRLGSENTLRVAPASGVISPPRGGVIPAKSLVAFAGCDTEEEALRSFQDAYDLGGVVSFTGKVDWYYAEGKSDEESQIWADWQWQGVAVDYFNLETFPQLDPYQTRRGPIPYLPPEIQYNSFADPLLREAYKRAALLTVQLQQPRWINLAMEINSYYEQRAWDFPNFVSLFKETRDQIKAISPDTMVFVSFQYELLLGIPGGRCGQPEHEPHWELFGMFEPDIDAIAITTYPMVTYCPTFFPDPDNIAPDYYRQIEDHTDLPIVFAEIGWPCDPTYNGSRLSQWRYIARLPQLTSGMNLVLANWYFLNNATGYGHFFESLGLVDTDQFRKPSFFFWKHAWSGTFLDAWREWREYAR